MKMVSEFVFILTDVLCVTLVVFTFAENIILRILFTCTGAAVRA